MDYSLFKIAGVVAGIGGLALATVVYIFREVIRKEIFPQLTKDQAYNLLNRIIVLTFVIGVLGIGAYLVLAWLNKDSNSNKEGSSNKNINGGQTPTPTPVKADLSGTVLDQNDRPLQGAKVTLDDLPGMQSVETSSNGVFNLRDIPKPYGAGVRVRVVMAGYQPNPYTEDVVLGKAPPIIKLRRRR
ncbi:MAG TPA: carboxypeptidase-like regulatory domain-containing protein [Pyrinomonadaceae bacterium]|jgi:hypothetical protein